MDIHALEAELHDQQVRYSAAVGELERAESLERHAAPHDAASSRAALDEQRERVRLLRNGIVDAMRRLAAARRDHPSRR